MTTYYVDTINGQEQNDGLTELTPVRDYKKLNIKPGDTVLFKRGTFIREKLYRIEGEDGKPITYGAYGEGEMPTFCGSVDLADPSVWTNEAGNIWYCNLADMDEAANFVFDNDLCGTLRWTKEELVCQGDFFDNCFGFVEKGRKLDDSHRIYLYSQGNPGEVYKSVECVVYGKRNLADNGRNIIYRDLKFINSGVHGIAGDAKTVNMKVIGCHFYRIGGTVWDYDQKIRFGNAIELWNVGENVEIQGCVFDDIYDSATTHQGGAECQPADNFIICDNVFKRCGMAAYEQRDVMPKRVVFSNNICIDAGEGFSKLGITMPRFSEIWPEPMGHHIFLWRIEQANDDSLLEIKDNIFHNAPYGAAIYSIISKDAEAKTKLSSNTYYSEGDGFIARWNGEVFHNFRDFEEYDLNGKYQKENIDILLEKKGR